MGVFDALTNASIPVFTDIYSACHLVHTRNMKPSTDDIIEAISNLYGLSPQKFKPINRFFYEYEDHIIRVIHHRNEAEVKDEVHWLNHLSDHKINVTRVLPSQTGQLFDTFKRSDTLYFVTTFEKAKGKPPTQAEGNADLFRRIGQLIGKMHKTTKSYTPIGSRKDWHDDDICNYDKYLPINHTLIREKCKEAIEEIQTLPKNRNTYGIIHSDIHQTNMHLRNDEITLFDFDDCEKHYFVNDLAIVIYWSLEVSFNGTDIHTYATTLARHLFRGYAEENDLDVFWFGQIPKFLKLREVISLIDAHREWDLKKLNENQKIILNHYRKNIEQDRPFLDLDFEHIYASVC